MREKAYQTDIKEEFCVTEALGVGNDFTARQKKKKRTYAAPTSQRAFQIGRLLKFYCLLLTLLKTQEFHKSLNEVITAHLPFLPCF